MNSYEIRDCANFFRDDPLFGPASQYLLDYHDLVQENSDGWAYWSYGTKCADTLCKLLDEAYGAKRYSKWDYTPPTVAELRAAMMRIQRSVKTNKYLKPKGIQPPVMPELTKSAG